MKKTDLIPLSICPNAGRDLGKGIAAICSSAKLEQKLLPYGATKKNQNKR